MEENKKIEELKILLKAFEVSGAQMLLDIELREIEKKEKQKLENFLENNL